MRLFRDWFDQVWLRSKLARNPQEVCMHGHLSNGHLNSLSNFNYDKVEKITSLRPLLDQPWITTKINSNVVKVGVHCYPPNAKINLRSNFNSEKLVKSETRLYGFAEVGIKGVQYFGMSQNFACTLVYQMAIQIYDQISIIRNSSKVKLRHAFSVGLGLKVVKIA